MISARGWSAPSAARLSEALRQALVAKEDATVSVTLGECELKRHRGSIHVVATRSDKKNDAAVTWCGEREVALPDGGVLVMKRERGTGLSAARLTSDVVTIRSRRGGEKLKTAPDRPRRTLKNLLQESGIPPWERERLPLLYCGDVLACVPGIGIEPAFRARAGEPSIAPEWRP
jgi:tRNA(Ile)-lysidine synthase